MLAPSGKGKPAVVNSKKYGLHLRFLRVLNLKFQQRVAGYGPQLAAMRWCSLASKPHPWPVWAVA